MNFLIHYINSKPGFAVTAGFTINILIKEKAPLNGSRLSRASSTEHVSFTGHVSSAAAVRASLLQPLKPQTTRESQLMMSPVWQTPVMIVSLQVTQLAEMLTLARSSQSDAVQWEAIAHSSTHRIRPRCGPQRRRLGLSLPVLCVLC